MQAKASLGSVLKRRTKRGSIAALILFSARSAYQSAPAAGYKQNSHALGIVLARDSRDGTPSHGRVETTYWQSANATGASREASANDSTCCGAATPLAVRGQDAIVFPASTSIRSRLAS